MTVTGIENSAGPNGRLNDALMDRIKSQAGEVKRTFNKKADEASEFASERTKKTSQKAYEVQISEEARTKGAALGEAK